MFALFPIRLHSRIDPALSNLNPESPHYSLLLKYELALGCRFRGNFDSDQHSVI